MDYSWGKKPATASSGAGRSSQPKPLIKCAGLGGNTSSIAKKKTEAVPKKPKSGIFEAKTYFILSSLQIL